MPMIHILNGPNLNLLGVRQPDIYGRETLKDVEELARSVCLPGFDVMQRQSNHEGVLVDWVHEARGTACALVVNAGAYTHTSVALLDALNTFEGLVVEVHISQVHKREAFRHHSYLSMRADAVIAGLGTEGYAAAVRWICKTAAARAI